MKEQTPQWLTDVQNNSWEPEIILSGLTITFLFIMDDKIFNFFAMLIQDYDIGVTGYILYAFAVLGLNAITVLLIFHLLLRGLWVGMIGLSYVYPQGIDESKLPLTFKMYGVEDARSYVITIEKHCSIFFSLIFTVIGSLAFTTIMITPLFAINIWVDDPGWYLPLFAGYVLVIIFPMAILPVLFKEKRWAKRMNNNFINCVINTMMSNPGGKVPFALFLMLIILSLSTSGSQMAQFQLLNPEPLKTPTQGLMALQQRHYLDSRNNGERLTRAAITAKDVSSDYLELHIAYYHADQQVLNRIKSGWTPDKDNTRTIDPAVLEEKGLPLLFNISIDGKEIKNAQWAMLENHQLEQKTYYVRLPIKDLKEGLHQLQINKVLLSPRSKHYTELKPWDRLIFYKVPSGTS